MLLKPKLIYLFYPSLTLSKVTTQIQFLKYLLNLI